MKKTIRIIIDILMYVDFIFLMNEGTDRNVMLHGICGIVLFALFIAHHILNIWFYKSVTKGRWNGRRILLNVTDWLLLLLMVLMAVSSVLMSGLVFQWSPVHTTQGARVLHVMSTSWAFIIMSFHVALHTDLFLKRIYENCSKPVKGLFVCLLVLAAGAGVFAFIKTQLYVYMFNTGGWKMAAPHIASGLLEYAGITAGMCAATGLVKILKGFKK